MCNRACLDFGAMQLNTIPVMGKKVIEVGARDVNGTFRNSAMTYAPASYLGVDLVDGPNVDEICDVENLVSKYGASSFDVVITTEMLEHVKDWRLAISQLKQLVKVGGSILITTRSKGFPFHEYPGDYWRFEVEDMVTIFSDFNDVLVLPDPSEPGVFVKATKPKRYKARELESIKLHSMLTDAIEV